jgi:hypothetical protein
MHTKLSRTPILVLTLVAALGAACTRTAENPSSTGTTGTATAVRVSQIDLGRTLNADKTVSDTGAFKPTDTVYASVATEGSAQNASLKARWTYQDGQVVNETTQTIAPTGNARTEFHVSKPDGFPPGKYKLEVFLNGSSAAAKDFEVQQ